jgi:hypothetical protein
MAIHLRFSHPGGWDRYRRAVLEGIRFEPARSFPQVLRHLEGPIDGVDLEVHAPPEVDVLGEIDRGVWAPTAVVRPPRDWRRRCGLS